MMLLFCKASPTVGQYKPIVILSVEKLDEAEQLESGESKEVTEAKINKNYFS